MHPGHGQQVPKDTQGFEVSSKRNLDLFPTRPLLTPLFAHQVKLPTSKDERISNHVSIIQAAHAKWLKAREMQDLSEWTINILAARGSWEILEKRMKVDRQVITTRVNRYVAQGSVVLWNPYHWDLESMMTRQEAIKLRPVETTQPSASRPRRGSHARNHSLPTFPTSPKSPARQRMMQLMFQQNRDASRNRIHQEAMAAHQYNEEQAAIARQKKQKQ